MLLIKKLNNKQIGGNACATPTTMCGDFNKVLIIPKTNLTTTSFYKFYLKVIYDTVDFSSLYHPIFNTNPFKHRNPNWKNSDLSNLQHGEYYEKINVFTKMNNKNNNFKYSNLINLLQILMNFIYIYLIPILNFMKISNPWDISWSDDINNIKQIDMSKIINDYKKNRLFVFHTNKAIQNMLMATEIYKDLMKDVNKEHYSLFPRIKIMNKEDEYSLDKFLWTEINGVYCCKLPSFDHVQNIIFSSTLNTSLLQEHIDHFSNKDSFYLNFTKNNLIDNNYKIIYYKLYYYFVLSNFYQNFFITDDKIRQDYLQSYFYVNKGLDDTKNNFFTNQRISQWYYYIVILLKNSKDNDVVYTIFKEKYILEIFERINIMYTFVQNYQSFYPQIIRKVSDGVNESAYLDIKPFDFELFF